MKKVIRSIISLILFFIFFLIIRVDTDIYCTRDYFLSNTDVQIEIDGKVIFCDSLITFPFVHIQEKLRYGFHEISVYSKKNEIIQTKKLFLLPYQYIFIEFLPGDANCLNRYANQDSIKNIKKDDVIIFYNDVNNEKKFPTFMIENRFKPFYIE